MPVRRGDVDLLAVTHPVGAADDVRQVDRVIGELRSSAVCSRARSGEFGA